MGAVPNAVKSLEPLRDAVCRLVPMIPLGSVATYGQIAAYAGRPRAARQVGMVLAGLPEDTEIPWQRVINAKGGISPRGKPGAVEIQRILLEEEGISFELDGSINLRKYLWQPDSIPE
jgi:methylated-DNA-protein-cysteine methyltransferase-like protein